MPKCIGKKGKDKITCNLPVLKCKKCGSIGCYGTDVSDKNPCTNRVFKNTSGNQCLKCGAWNPEPVK